MNRAKREIAPGEVFGGYTVIFSVVRELYGVRQTTWFCQCKCGAKSCLTPYTIGKNKFGCMSCRNEKIMVAMRVAHDRIKEKRRKAFRKKLPVGTRIGHLVSKSYKKDCWTVRCDCGKKKRFYNYQGDSTNALRKGITKSCHDCASLRQVAVLAKYQNEATEKVVGAKACEFCEKDFPITEYEKNMKRPLRFCSDRCREWSRKGLPKSGEFSCATCGVPVKVTGGRAKKRAYCGFCAKLKAKDDIKKACLKRRLSNEKRRLNAKASKKA